MKILIASDSFKGCCNTLEAAEEFERGVRRVLPDAGIKVLPIADGGEGTVEAVISARGGSLRYAKVKGPSGLKVRAAFGLITGEEAVIEMASASGLTLIRGAKDPMSTTTYGTGQLIKEALDLGCKRIFIGIGGSATNDGGAGMARALGAGFLDRKGKAVPPGGGSLHLIKTIDISGLDSRLKSTEIVVMSDVNIPLCGKNGASAVFAPQKGASQKQVELLDAGLAHFAERVREQLGIDYRDAPGAGAAGGLGYGLMVFAGAQIRSGIRTILDINGFDKLASDADIIISGEGSIDGQSIYGKVPVGIAQRAKKLGKPVVVIAGGIGKGAEKVFDYGIDAIISSTCRPMAVREAIDSWRELLADAAERAMRMILVGMQIRDR